MAKSLFQAVTVPLKDSGAARLLSVRKAYGTEVQTEYAEVEERTVSYGIVRDHVPDSRASGNTRKC